LGRASGFIITKKSINFKIRYEKNVFDSRKADLLKKLEHGKMRIDLAINAQTKEPVGYCINTIVYGPAPEGEIDSLFVHPGFRGNRIAEKLMKLAIEWFDSNNIVTRKIVVAAGNEDVFPFYENLGFIINSARWRISHFKNHVFLFALLF